MPCKHDPRETHRAVGMYHCPECREMVIAGMLHTENVVMYYQLIEKIRSVGKACGYAICTHGSMERDIDLVAVPWVDCHNNIKTLINMICGVIGYKILGDITGRRPGGRRSVLLIHPDAVSIDPANNPKGRWDPKAIDLSVFPSYQREIFT